MQSNVFVFAFTASLVAAQTLTVTFPNGGPTVVQAFTTINGFPQRVTLATLTQTSTPRSSTSDLPSTTSPGPSPTASGVSSPRPKRPTHRTVSGAAIAGILIGICLLLIIACLIFFLQRRRKRRRWDDRFVKIELDPVGSPVVDKQFIPDPFMTDSQARGLGYDVSQQSTRRIGAQFVFADQGSSKEQPPPVSIRISDEQPEVPRIYLTSESEDARPLSLSGSSQQTGSLSGHVQSDTSSSVSPYSRDVKIRARSPTPSVSYTSTAGPGASTSLSPAEAEAESAQRMRDLLTQLENPGSTNPNTAVNQLQRQVEILRRENEELRLGAPDIPPPAYEEDGRDRATRP